MKRYLLFFILLATIVSSCSEDNFKETEKPQKEDDVIQSVNITNNAADLSSRVTYSDKLVIVNDIRPEQQNR
ncbi:hypothetical protein [Marinifilum fragile]|uniref:hypothetical protein n=1 Tax=Marinifilum fragile TaxID=570161 RepID=UPI0006CF65B7|nr:hypothetical protein [Marinifilum fragile]